MGKWGGKWIWCSGYKADWMGMEGAGCACGCSSSSSDCPHSLHGRPVRLMIYKPFFTTPQGGILICEYIAPFCRKCVVECFTFLEGCMLYISVIGVSLNFEGKTTSSDLL